MLRSLLKAILGISLDGLMFYSFCFSILPSPSTFIDTKYQPLVPWNFFFFSFRVRKGQTNIIETTISRIWCNDMDQCLLKFQGARSAEHTASQCGSYFYIMITE